MLRRRAYKWSRGVQPVVLAVVSVLAVSVTFTACGEQEGLSGVVRSPALDASGVSLPATKDGGGETEMSFTAGQGELLLVYFGYTSCPDVCPTTFADLRSAIGKLPEADRDRVEVAMVTVDPERDTEQKMADYLGFFFDGWRAYRTTDSEELARAERAFMTSHEIGKKDRDGTYEVSHSATVFAVGSEGEVRVEWPFGTSAEVIARDLRLLLGKDVKQ